MIKAVAKQAAKFHIYLDIEGSEAVTHNHGWAGHAVDDANLWRKHPNMWVQAFCLIWLGFVLVSSQPKSVFVPYMGVLL